MLAAHVIAVLVLRLNPNPLNPKPKQEARLAAHVITVLFHAVRAANAAAIWRASARAATSLPTLAALDHAGAAAQCARTISAAGLLAQHIC
jgi:hypothetical protein